ncbi:MAG: class I SAM-dependent methyltransferase [Bacteroidota bacterium]
MKEFWDQRFAESKYKYGKKPNNFFYRYLRSLSPGRILLPGEGEGRNAVFAARNRWEVTAVDFSIKGKEKAERLATENQVELTYIHKDILDYEYPQHEFDAVSLIFVHLSPEKTATLYKKIYQTLRPGGIFFSQLYSKDQLRYETGGPKNEVMLYSIKELENYLQDFHIKKLKKHERLINEGDMHFGHSSVIDFAAKKT